MASTKNSAEPPSVSDCFQTTDYVKVYVGPQRKMWYLNEELLCTRIDYFRAAFRSGGGGFQEGAEKSIHLAEEEPSTFERLVEWLPLGTFGCGYCDSLADKSFEEAVKFYLLAERLGCIALRDELLSWLRDIVDHIGFNDDLTPELLVLIYDQTIVGSPIRETIVNRVTMDFFLGYGYMTGEYHQFSVIAGCAEFIQEVMVSIDKHLLEGSCCLSQCKAHTPYKYKGQPAQG